MTFDHQLNELWQSNQLIDSQLIRYEPSDHLTSIVEQYFVVNDGQCDTAPIYILPDLSGHLLIHQFKNGQAYQYRFSLVGSRTSGFRINRKNRVRTFIIRFRPGMLSKVTKILGQESADQSFPLALFFPIVTEQLAMLFSAKIHKLEDFQFLFQWLEINLLEPLLANLQLPKPILGFLEHLKSKEINLNVNTTAKKLGISERYLRKITNAHLGMPPNKAIRIGRLIYSFEHRIQHPQYNWSDIAFLSGYADQSHMIEEYQELLKRTPRQVVASLSSL